MALTLPSLHADALHCVASWLDSASLSRLSSACRSTRETLLRDDALWRAACTRDWGLPKVAVGSGLAVWRRSHGVYGAAGFAPARHARRVWTRLESWAARHFRPALHSLGGGLSAAEIAAAAATLGVAFPPAFIASLLVHDGQVGTSMGQQGEAASWQERAGLPLAGIFGGTCVYDELVVVGAAQLRFVVSATRTLRASPLRLRAQLVVVGVGRDDHSALPDVLLLLDTQTGLLYRMLGRCMRLVRAVSHAAALASHARHGLPPPESADVDSYCWLRYLAEMAERLDGGVFRVRRLPQHSGDAGGSGAWWLSVMADAQRAQRAWWAATAAAGGEGDAPAGAPPPPPPASGRVVHADARRTERDAWAATLRANPLDVHDFAPAHWRYICVFAEGGPTTSLAVTGGVHTVTSGVHVHVSTVLRTRDCVIGERPDARAKPAHCADCGGRFASAAELRAHSCFSEEEPPAVAPVDVAAPPLPGFQRAVSVECSDARHARRDPSELQLSLAYRVRLWYARHEDVAPTDGGSSSSSSAAGGEAAALSAAAAALAGAARVRLSAGVTPYASVQLDSRHWRIEDECGHVEQVQGAGVVGLHPLLRPLPAGVRCVDSVDALAVAAAVAGGAAELVNGLPVPRLLDGDSSQHGGGGGGSSSSGSGGSGGGGRGGGLLPEPFEYASVTRIAAASGSMGGSFTMRPGQLSAATGPDIRVAVGAFALGVPEFIF